MLQLLPDALLIYYKWNCSLYGASCRGYQEPPTISQDHIKAISSAVIHQSDSVMLTTVMQFYAVHYGYDLWSSEAELQSHATESSESGCYGICCTSTVCVRACVRACRCK